MSGLEKQLVFIYTIVCIVLVSAYLIISFSKKLREIQFRKEDWLLENKLVVVETLVDMSCNYCITAPKEWILGVCPDFFEKYSKFVREPEEDEDTPYGQFGCPFLEYTEENLGYWFAGWDEEWNPRRLEKGFYDEEDED